ncbi:YisL family protein [Pseudalkalibacillus sp. A8]|uniref:YisL family protein n=1 Tax=Pseudalkalibacillus sp. A8 TaxID=3382641 RepID=UPI0038B41BE6
MLHAHVTSWAIAIILFFVAYFLMKAGKAKGHKITSMILRLFYVFIIVTGGMKFIQYLSGGYYAISLFVKALAGIWVIGSMEMVLAKAKKGASVTGMWIMFFISLILVLYLGYSVL